MLVPPATPLLLAQQLLSLLLQKLPLVLLPLLLLPLLLLRSLLSVLQLCSLLSLSVSVLQSLGHQV